MSDKEKCQKLIDLGILSYEQCDYEQAITYFKGAINADEYNPYSYNNLGLVLKTIGRLQEAINNYEEAISIFEAWRSMGSQGTEREIERLCLNLGSLYEEIGDNNKAISVYNNGLKFKPLSPDLNFNLGCLHYNQKNDRMALTYFKEVVRLNPNDAEAHLVLGSTYLLLRDIQGARQELIALEHLDKNRANKLLNLISKAENEF